MSGFQHILVPIDFGAVSEHALNIALELASKIGAAITLLHVSSMPPTAQVSFAAELPWPTDAYAAGAKKALDAIATRARTRFARVDDRVVKGDPRDEILSVATDIGADLIVMGTHGRRGLPHLLLGSVAEHVVRLSPIAVMTISSHDVAAARASHAAERS